MTDTAVPTHAAPQARAARVLITPEGIPISVRLAERGTRAAAFLIDLIILSLSLGVVALSLRSAVDRGVLDGRIGMSVGILIYFLVRSFYFTFFELRWRGQTPGKRIFALRVIDGHGGPLRGEAVIARNLMREVEFFLPATLILAAGTVSGAALWERLLGIVWLGTLVALPFFNRDRLRAGDMVGGTWVIDTPRISLLADVVETTGTRPDAAGYSFTPAQLGVYGVYELQVLEHLLRGPAGETAIEAKTVYERVAAKIGWTPAAGQSVAPRGFLAAFYAAQRAHLEQRMLLGQRRHSKHDT